MKRDLCMVRSGLLAVSSSFMLLSGCGGGGGGGASQTTNNDPSAFPALTISGVAATGAAISGGSVSAKCLSGTGSATTNADGSYSVTLQNGSAPCLLRVTDEAHGVTLHSLLEQGQTKANITPLTELIVASVMGETPSTAFSDFSSERQNKVSENGVSQAVARIQVMSSSLGADADLSGIDPLKDTFQAASNNTSGDEKDRKIDALMVALAAADKTIEDLTTQLKTATSDSEVTQSLTTVLGDSATALESCSFARSGDYWVLNFAGSEPIIYSVDFSTMTATRQVDDVTGQITSNSNTTCGFNLAIEGRNYEFRSSRAGISVWKGSNDFGLIVPVQTTKSLSDSAFSGTYPGLGFLQEKRLGIRDAAPFKFTVSESGEVSGFMCDMAKALPDCDTPVEETDNDVTCTELRNGAVSCSSPNGDTFVGIPYVSGGVVHLFMSITNFNLSPYSFGGLIVMTKASEMNLPDVGDTILAGQGWYAGVNPLESSVVSGSTLGGTVESVDESAGSFVTSTTGTAITSRTYINRPANGLIFTSLNASENGVLLGSPAGWSVGILTSGNRYYDGWAAYVEALE